MHVDTIDLAELSEVLHIKRRNIAFKLRQLNQEHDFPAPLPGVRGLWSRSMVTDWINRKRSPAPNVVDYMAEARKRMARKPRK